MGKSEDDESSRGRERRWRAKLRVINERFASRLDESVYEGVRDEGIYHGLKLGTAQPLYRPFADLCFCTETQEYLLLSTGLEIQRYSMQGKLLHPAIALDPTQTFTRMQWCDGALLRCLVCHDPEAEYVWILDSAGVGLVTVKAEFHTKSLYYEPSGNVIVIVGVHQMIKFALDDKEQDQELDSSKALTYSDPEFGPAWQLECSSLIPQSASAPARLVTSYLTTLYLLPLEIDADADIEEGQMEFSAKRANASKAPITVVHYLASSAWIITGDQQGNVVGWSLNFECTMTRSGVHEDKLTILALHPSICGFLSYSQGPGGNKLQVWSCNFRDAIEAFVDLGAIKAIAINEATVTVVTLGAKLNYLTMHQVYNFYAPLTAAARSLTSTNNPMYSTKVIASSADNSVRIFSSCGKQLNVQILPEETLYVVSAVFSGNKNQLFTIILKTGEILVSDTSVCPMKFRNVFVNDTSKITCITVYEYFDEIRESDGSSKKPRIFYPICIRLIVGTEEGNLIVINDDTGKPEYICPAHTGSVVQLRFSMLSHHVISLGIDRCVKVWRVFADLPQPLALYYTLYFIVPITQVASMGHVLCMANSAENSKIHQVIMENMSERVRLEHHNSKDHTAAIVDMITSETLGLCATSSLDNTIRIWDQENCLLKILMINTCALHTTFASLRGDIVFSAGRHLYKIPYENYLSPKYRAKIVANDLPEEKDEDTVSKYSQFKFYDDIIDVNSMLRPVSSIPQASIDITNADNPRVDFLIQKQICALYQDRDTDIIRIKEHLIAPTHAFADRALMTTEAWDKYVADLLNSMTRPAAEAPEYDFPNIQETKSTEKKTYNDRGVFQMLFGYSVDELDDAEDITELIRGSKLPLNGFLPNSILYKIKEIVIPEIVSTESIVKEPVKYRYPPEFSTEEEEPSEARESIRLSQIMTVDKVENEETA